MACHAEIRDKDKHMNIYRGAILSIERNKTLLELRHVLQRVMGQMAYLAQLCWCGRGQCGSEDNRGTFPVVGAMSLSLGLGGYCLKCVRALILCC